MKNFLSKSVLATLLVLAVFTSCEKDDSVDIQKIEITNSYLTSDSITFSWEKISNALAYSVELTMGDSVIDSYYTEDLEVSFRRLSANTEYKFSIEAYKDIMSNTPIAKDEVVITTKSLPAVLVSTWAMSQETWVFNADGTGTYTYNSEAKIWWTTRGDDVLIVTKKMNEYISQTKHHKYEVFDDGGRITIDGNSYFNEND